METKLNYLVGVGGVLLVQLAISWGTIVAGTGNGSFVGLGAMLLALFGIPATAIVNFVLVQSQQRNPGRSNVSRIIAISSILPVLQLALLMAQIVFDL